MGTNTSACLQVFLLFIYLFLAIMGFEFRAFCFLGRPLLHVFLILPDVVILMCGKHTGRGVLLGGCGFGGRLVCATTEALPQWGWAHLFTV
jgi:hypothetical protein